jgi:hypothetical protein
MEDSNVGLQKAIFKDEDIDYSENGNPSSDAFSV